MILLGFLKHTSKQHYRTIVCLKQLSFSEQPAFCPGS